jgi:redox-sensitive bicupin YhaK (pirin superfamily)
VKPDYAQQSFANAPTNALTLACSPDGHSKSIKINQDVELFIGKLAPQGKINHSIQERRGAWIQLIEGDLTLGGTSFRPVMGRLLMVKSIFSFRPTRARTFLCSTSTNNNKPTERIKII